MPGDRSYDNSRHLDAEGIPDLEDPINQDEGLIPPGDLPKAVDEYGITANEARTDEPISERVTREVPETAAGDVDLSSAEGIVNDSFDGMRLVEPGSEDVMDVDEEKDAIGSMIEDEGAESAEEAAMHVTDQP